MARSKTCMVTLEPLSNDPGAGVLEIREVRGIGDSYDATQQSHIMEKPYTLASVFSPV